MKSYHFSYGVFGNPDSRDVILFFHGFPGSHLQASFLDQKLKDKNLKMIAVDRPGYGNSEWIDPRNWQTTVSSYFELIQKQGFEKLSIMGVSGGAPMAHMSASHLKNHVEKLVIVCGLASFSKMTKPTFGIQQKRLLKLAQILPSSVIQKILDYLMTSLHPEKRLSHLIRNIDETDKFVLSKTEHQEKLLIAMRWARNQKSKGVVWDSKIFSTDWWSLHCQSMSIPTVYFHGENDFLLNPEMSKKMSQQNAQSVLRLIPAKGHYAIAFENQGEILAELGRSV